MTNHQSVRRVFIAAAIFVVIGTLVLPILGKSSQQCQNPPTEQKRVDDALALRNALRRGGVREAAKLKGKYVAEYDPHWHWGMFSLEDLTKNSVAVIVGRFTKQLAAHIPDSRLIFTDYEVAVEELVKGDIKEAKTIVVTLPGGRMDFEDGTSAEQTTPSFERPVIGRTYTLFLMREAALPSVFFLVGGPQGMFDIEGSAGVKSHGRPDDPAAVETKGKNRESFLKNVREHAQKWPNPGKCCD